jgi:ACS family hexuronate transporter-like MFS transporter
MPVENTSDFALVRAPADPGTPTRGGAWSVALCSLALAAGAYATLGFAPLAPLIRSDLSLARWQIGAISALVFGGAAITSVPSGRWTDRFGAPPMLAAAVAAVAGGSVLAALAPGALLFLLGVAGVGLAYGLITPPTNVIVSGAPTTRHRSLLMSIKQVGVTIGGFVAGITMPVIAHQWGWRLALLAPAVACAAVSLAALASRRTLGRNAGAAQREPLPGRTRAELPRRFALGVSGFGFVMGGLQISFVTYLALFLKEDHGYRLSAAGISLAVTMVAGTVGRLLWAVISDRWFAARRAAGLRLNALLSIAGMAGLALLPTGLLIWPCVALVGFANIGWNGVYMTLVAESAPSGEIGRVTGRALRVVFSGAVVLPPLLGLVADRSGWTAGWLSACALAGVAAISMSVAVLAQARETGLQSSDLLPRNCREAT